jgi:hypothetical protein
MGTDQGLLIVALKLVLISGEIRKGPDVSHFDGVSIYTLVGVIPIKQPIIYLNKLTKNKVWRLVL